MPAMRYLCRMRMIRGLVPATVFCVWAVAQAGVYTWVDDQGVRHFSDHPVSANARAADIEISDARRPPPSAAPVTQRINVLSPKPGARVVTANGVVEVAVEIHGQLGANEQLVYNLDRQTVAKSPTRMLSFSLAGLPAGPHAFQVVLLAGEREIARTEPIAFTVELSAEAASAGAKAQGRKRSEVSTSRGANNP